MFYVKDKKSNLISYSNITESNKIVFRNKMTKIIDSNGKVTAVALKINSLYIMKSKLKSTQPCVNIANKSISSISEKEIWNRMLGHVNFRYLNILSENQVLSGIPSKLELDFMKCKTRQKVKCMIFLLKIKEIGQRKYWKSYILMFVDLSIQ